MIPNYDDKAQIHYGVISMHDITQAWCDESQPWYGDETENEDEMPEEPISFYIDDEDYTCETCLDSDVMVMKSPYYTYARECSPCVPNAGNLNSTDNDAPLKTYCFGHDWFEDGVAPYPVFSVANDEEVFPDNKPSVKEN